MMHLDLETFSEAPLAKTGAAVYAAHPSTRVLLIAWAFDDAPVRIWDATESQHMPPELRAALDDPKMIVCAHNASFERLILRHVLGIDIPAPRWRCTMVMAHYASMPGSLGQVGTILGLPDDQQKLNDGRRLIRRFCLPQKTTTNQVHQRRGRETDPEDWERFKQYCLVDVEAERAIYKRLLPFDLPAHEWAAWHLDQKINDSGWPIDRQLVTQALKIAKAEKTALVRRLKQITGLQNGNSVVQLLGWLSSLDCELSDLTKNTVEQAISDVDDVDIHAALVIRQQLSKTSVEKYKALDLATGDDGRLRHILQFMGAARTGRWAGRIFQPQNLPRPEYEDLHLLSDLIRNGDHDALDLLYRDVMGALSSCIRSAIRAPEGKRLVVSDLNAIENRVLGWVCGAESVLQVFREDRCPYKAFGSALLGKPYDEITKAERTFAKPPVLGCFGADTPVLTDRGWVPMVEVSVTDRVHDGVGFVSHGGVLDQGVKETINLCGVRVTPDHQILCGDTWRESWELANNGRYVSEATGLATGLLSTSRSTSRSAPGMSASAPVAADKTSPARRTLSWGSRLLASLVRTGPSTSKTPYGVPSACLKNTSTDCRTGIMRSNAAVKTPRTDGSPATEGVASGVFSPTVRLFCAMLKPCPAGISRSWKSTGSTMTGIIGRAISGLLPVGSKPETPVKTSALSTEASGSPLWSFGSGTPRGIEAKEPLPAKSDREYPRSRSSRIKTDAAAPTYDIRDAGPRHRFVILTDGGPMIAHNCGYGLGAIGLKKYAASMGVEMTDDEAENAKNLWRETYWEVPGLWADLDDAVRKAIIEKKAVTAGVLTIDYQKPCLRIRLPSGRHLHYIKPRIEERETPWGESRPSVTYEGMDQYTRKWMRLQTHPGKLVENVVQAIARDVLVDGLHRADARGFEVVGHVHDEVVTLVDEDSPLDDGALSEALSVAPIWAFGLPLAAAGYTDTIYRKD